MSKLKIVAILLVLISLLVIVPASYAGENQTDINLVSEDTNILADEYYFDADIDNDTGDGSKYNPYKDFSYSKIQPNSVVHLAEGEYYLDERSYIADNMTFIGENAKNTIVHANGYTITAKNTLTFINLTFDKLSISNNGNINAVNTVFKSSAKSVIDSIGSDYQVSLVNCTFDNNQAENGGAIYMDGGYLNIEDSQFLNNYAKNSGGAIYTDFVNATITSTKFRNNHALNELGGAIYIYNSPVFNCINVEVNDNDARFGGAIAALDSITSLNNITARNNRAKYYGGAVFAIYHTLSIENSILDSNSASDGGALYADHIDSFIIHSNIFSNNNAEKTAGAVYSVLSEYYYDSIFDDALNNTFINNTAILENDVYASNMVNLTVGNNNYILIKYGSSFNGTLPSGYDLRDYGYVTSVKNQGNDANCWSFAALAALESAILKANGMTFDLSEENMKNLMSYYSDYGWTMATNKGGYDKMAVGYLTSWLGPINDTDDVYIIDSLISPKLDSFIHVQNILFLTRSSYTDNDAIKRAIMDYGAVSTSIYWSSAYLKNRINYYYNGNTGANHAVAIIGWDDNYSASNFNNAPPGDGAWIIKNSWGEKSGNKGFYYVSYYDTKCAPINKSTSYTFIFNDTIRYDKNYQYDISGRTDSFFNTTSTVWYKNRFTATDDEYLAAVSTYFEKNTQWDLSVYVNDALKLSQSGFSLSSYSTINLNQLIPLKLGDVFEIIFKITVDDDAGVPISEAVSLINEIYSENISFVSYDGKTWKDFYELPWTYPDHKYDSQVACIKAFTILNPLNSFINLTITDIGQDTIDILANIYDEYGNSVDYGEVAFNISGEIKKMNVNKGTAKFDNVPVGDSVNKFTAVFSAVGYNQSTSSVLFSKTLLPTTLYLDCLSNHNFYEFNVRVVDANNKSVESGKVIFTIDGVNYTCDVNDGNAYMNISFKTFGLKNVYVTYNDLYCYNSSNATQLIYVTASKTSITLFAGSEFNPILLTANVIDEEGNNVDKGVVTFVIGNDSYKVNVADGTATFSYVFVKEGLNHVLAYYSDDSYMYASSSVSKDVPVSYKDTNMMLNVTSNQNVANGVNIVATVMDTSGQMVLFGQVTFEYNGKSRVVSIVDGKASNDCIFDSIGLNTLKVSYSDSNYYKPSNKTVSLYVSKTKVEIVSAVNIVYNNATVDFTISKSIDEHITVYVDDTYYLLKLKNGKATIDLNSLNAGIHTISAIINSSCYESELYKTQFTIDKLSTELVCSDEIIYMHNDMSYRVGLKDVFGNPLCDYQIALKVNGKTYRSNTDKNGYAVFKFNLGIGTYSADVRFNGNQNYLNSNSTKKITVKTTIELPSAAKYTYNSIYDPVLHDKQGNLLKNQNVDITVGKTVYSLKTDANGKLDYVITLTPGTYSVSVENPQTGEVKNQSITVVKRITENKAITMYYGAGKYYKVRVYDDHGNIAKRVKVTFTINGKTYSRNTDPNGYASFKITLQAKTYTITANYKGYKVSNKIVVKPTLILKDKSVKRSKTFKYTVKLLNNKGKILKYKKVTVKFRGKTYNVKTSSKGIATFKIKALSKTGKFTLTASYGSAKISKKITVKK
ncbi:C1 family peptidase [Methanobrevibacter sp.]|uniref:C1 family peptidase n=1 Tax=Methanobrevibacter sp. TaxID=66852 RepID=UPI00388F072B